MKKTLIALLFFSSACGDVFKSHLLDPGVSEELANYRSETLTNIYYTLNFNIPREHNVPIQGKLRVKFELSSLEHPVVLDFNAPTDQIRTVSSPMTGYLKYRHENEHIIIDQTGLREGYNDIEIEFTASELGLNRQEEFVYTLLVPDRASSLFPCFDQPNLKGTYGLTLVIPEDWVAVTTGVAESERVVHGRKTIQYDRTLPISTYLFSFAAGKFDILSDTRDTRTINLYHRETDSLKVARNIREIFDLHWSALSWLQYYTDQPYPFKKFDFVALPSFQYGGMEHPGTIHYRARSLWLDESATPNQYLGRASLIAHETAHMWFGNLVTMKWFDDVWLKEVFANFMADKVVNPSFPDINHDLKFLLRHHPAAYEVDRSGGANAIKQPLENLKHAGTLYGGIIYNKAPIMMKQLEKLIGEDQFQQGIKEYMAAHTYGNADWSDLIAILDAKTDEDLQTWSDIWISGAGMPKSL